MHLKTFCIYKSRAPVECDMIIAFPFQWFSYNYVFVYNFFFKILFLVSFVLFFPRAFFSDIIFRTFIRTIIPVAWKCNSFFHKTNPMVLIDDFCIELYNNIHHSHEMFVGDDTQAKLIVIQLESQAMLCFWSRKTITSL